MSNCRLERRNVPNDSEKFKWIRYITVLLALAGLYYKPLKWRSIWSLIYPLFMLLITATLSFYQITIHQADDGFTLTMLKFVSNARIWPILVIQIIFLFRITPRLKTFFEKYKEFKHEYHSQSTCFPDRHSKHLKKKIFLSFLILWFIPYVIEIYALMDGLIRLWFSHFFFSDNAQTVNVTTFLIIFMFAVLRFIFITVLVCVFIICYACGNDYTIITEDLKSYLDDDAITHDLEEGEREIQSFRRRFLQLNDLTTEMDNVLGPLSLTILISGVIYVILHVMAGFDYSSYGVSGNTFIITACLSAISSVANLAYFMYACVSFTSKATSIKPLLLSANVGNRSQGFFREVIMLLHKVNQDHMGLTAYGLFGINKSFIVSLVTISVSYAVIVLRFGVTFNQDKQMDMSSLSNLSFYANNSYCTCMPIIPTVS